MSAEFAFLKMIVAVIICFIGPIYLLMRNSIEDDAEAMILSLLSGLAIIPFLTFYLYKILPSLRWSYIIIILVIYTVGLKLWKRR
jgi:hypothetical protein